MLLSVNPAVAGTTSAQADPILNSSIKIAGVSVAESCLRRNKKYFLNQLQHEYL